ncbi:MAG TPA: signal peptidase I [Solirubrobacterales bacterium]|nr:signal peptidase I [Solirubrobacterales bacterium]
MKLVGSLGSLLVALSLAACGADGGDTTTYTYPSESMEPSISYLLGDECKVAHPFTEPCPQPTAELSSQTFLKRIVALPGEELSIRDGLPIVNGKAVLADVIQRCSAVDLCKMPEPITIPPGHYFVMGDNSGSSSDSRWWGAVPRAGIIGKLEE